MQKPLNMSVTTTSKMIMPPMTPKSDDITAWVTLTAYVYGDIIRTSLKTLYWCTVAGDSGAAEPTHVSGDAADGTVTWRRLVGLRDKFFLVNDGAVPVYLGFGNDAEANKGIRLNASGGAMSESLCTDIRLMQAAIYAITASGTSSVGIQELP